MLVRRVFRLLLRFSIVFCSVRICAFPFMVVRLTVGQLCRMLVYE